ncbi:MAG: hypothetical protein K2H47_09945 [Muribaculaceae bacterium]|nr:hypothetical protein [Muribaculaceae bacterium]
MKKFYALTLAALSFGLMANAASPVRNTEFSKASDEGFQPLVNKTMLKAPAKVAVNADDVYGMYMWISITGLATDGPRSYEQNDIKIVKGASDNEVLLYGLNPMSDVIIKGTLNTGAGTITVPDRQKVGEYTHSDNKTYNVYFTAFDLQTGALANSPIVLTYSENGVLTTEYGIAIWIPDLDGGFLLEMDNSFYKRGELSNEGWVDAGKATFTDGWVNAWCDAVEVPFTSAPYEVDVQRSVENDKVIRLVNPYSSGPYAALNASNVGGAIEIDYSNPKCVLVKQGETVELGQFSDGSLALCFIGAYPGFYWQEMGQAIYPGNFAFYYNYMEGFEVDEIVEEFEGEEGFLSYMDGNTIVIEGATFGASGACGRTYGGWSSPDQLGIPMIELNENSVALVGDDANAPVEYYNLQGLKINNPTEGELVIMRQGNTAKKIVVRK